MTRPATLTIKWRGVRSWRTAVGVERDVAAEMVSRLLRDPAVEVVTVDLRPESAR